MKATLDIYGDIGETDALAEMFGGESTTISAKDVRVWLDENKSATEIVVRINSRGGDVQEGWAIHDLLVNSGKKVKTIGEGKIYSIATIVFLAGEEREIMKNADGLIHNPYIPEYTLAGAYESTDLLKIAEALKQEEAKILSFYVERTGAPEDKLAEYMKEDTKLSAEDMLSLGFATKIVEPIRAYAYIKPNNKTIMTEKEVKTLGEKLDTLIERFKNFSRLTVKNMTLTDKDGKELEVEKEAGDPAVGDKASPDGTFEMSDGMVITVEGGEITAIAEPEEDELEAANAKISELEATIADLQAKAAEAAKMETEAAALVTELTNLKNSWKPPTRTKIPATESKVGEINLDRVKELNEKIKNNKK